jgi:Fe-S cluster assembly ATP-binding protein
MSILEVKDLHANIHNHEILKGVDLTVNPGEVHSVMGPNGSGKSTLAQVLARRESYEVTRGKVLLNGKDLLAMKPEEAACEGLFMAFQYPVEIPGISNAYFLRAAVNAIRKYRGEEELDAMDFLPLLKEKMRLLEMDERFLSRPVNEETDSGLDIDALKIVAKGVNAMRSADRAILVVTHYQRLLNYIVPDYVHVLVDGRIVKSGGPELALELEEKGYGWAEPASASAR